MKRYGCFEFDGTLSLSPAPDGDWVKYSEVIAYLAPSVATEDAIMAAAREAEADILRCFYVRHTNDGKPWHDMPPTIEDGELRWHIEQAIRKHLGERQK